MEQDLKAVSRQIREETVGSIGSIGIGHIGGCLSLAEILAVLYFKQMNIDPKNPQLAGRDRLIVSKGHAGPAVYAALALRGYFPKDDLMTLNASGTNLPSHCDMNRTPGIDMTTGSLGQGFSCAVGVALASRLRGEKAAIFTIIGDGESQEGQIWEAAMFAGNQKLNRLIAFTDCNNLQIDGFVSQVNDIEPLEDKWRAFKWHTRVVDGHDLQAIDSAVTDARGQDKPTMIIARTIKGKGVSSVVSMGAGNHNMPFGEEDARKAIEELRSEP